MVGTSRKRLLRMALVSYADIYEHTKESRNILINNFSEIPAEFFDQMFQEFQEAILEFQNKKDKSETESDMGIGKAIEPLLMPVIRDDDSATEDEL